MASLNDVLKEILEKDFEKEDVEKVVDSVESNDENKETGEETPEGREKPIPAPVISQNSVGRGAVEASSKIAFMKIRNRQQSNEKLCPDDAYAKMLSDFGRRR